MCGGVHDVITGNKFDQNRLRGFRATGVQKLGTPIDLACRPYNSSALPCWLWWDGISPVHQKRFRQVQAIEFCTCQNSDWAIKCFYHVHPLWATIVGQPHSNIIICRVQLGQATSQLCQQTGIDNVRHRLRSTGTQVRVGLSPSLPADTAVIPHSAEAM